MFGGGYSAFTPWATAKQHPKALKSIMVGAPVAPGIDAPKEGNVFWNFVYPWPFYTTNNKTLDNEINYGTGREVVDESIADAKTPLQISWFGGSYLDLPVHR